MFIFNLLYIRLKKLLFFGYKKAVFMIDFWLEKKVEIC